MTNPGLDLAERPFRERLARDVDLARYSNYETGGTARWFIEPRSESDFVESIAFARQLGLPWFILGGGTNTLIQDQVFEGLVIATARWEGREILDDGAIVARSGTSLRTLIGAAICEGWEGLEGFIGIPGSIGGAVWGNAGGATGGIAPLVESVRVIDPQSFSAEGTFGPPEAVVQTISGSELPWDYRYSGIGDRIIVEVRLRLAPGASRENLRVRALDVLERKKHTQPLQARSAGCVFRNPPGDSAGRLIEAAGWKGRKLGGACVSPQHANFIVNDGGATATEIFRLIEEVRSAVGRQFGVWLEREIVVARPEHAAGEDE